MPGNRKVTMKNGSGDQVVITYDASSDHTYIFNNGEKVYEGGGDRVQDQVDAYTRQGWIVVG